MTRYLLVAIASASLALGEVSITGLGRLPGHSQSYGYGISADGTTIVGTSSDGAGENQAFIWSQQAGMIGLGDLPGGGVDSHAYGISADGSTVVGVANASNVQQAFRWSASTGLVGLGGIPGDPNMSRGAAYAVSANGGFIAGRAGGRAVRWNPDGSIAVLSSTQGLNAARAINGDGSVAGGGTGGFDRSPFRWSQDSGRELLPGSGVVRGMNTDGTVLVGGPAGGDLAIWAASGLQRVASGAPGAAIGQAISDTGIVVGAHFDGVTPRSAMFWNGEAMTRLLADALLADYGLDVGDWILREAAAITPDGRTIAGWGINPAGEREAFVIRIPEPASVAMLAVTLLAAVGRRR